MRVLVGWLVGENTGYAVRDIDKTQSNNRKIVRGTEEETKGAGVLFRLKARSNYSAMSSDTVLSQDHPAEAPWLSRDSPEVGLFTYLEQRAEGVVSQWFWETSAEGLACTGGYHHEV
jgi:hypothetical protein